MLRKSYLIESLSEGGYVVFDRSDGGYRTCPDSIFAATTLKETLIFLQGKFKAAKQSEKGKP